MNNIIKNNRIIGNHTFATRFLSFVEGVQVVDACSSDEKEAMLNTAKSLLKYQCKTAINADEILYLESVGVYEKYTKPFLITEDGTEIDEDDNEEDVLFSCMKKPRTGEQIEQFQVKKLKNKNPDRIFFKHRDNCVAYIHFNTPIFSRQDLINANIQIIR
jgi:hypothetical protein